MAARVNNVRKLYEQTIIDYASKLHGHIVAFTEDQTFLSLLRTTLQKDLGIELSGFLTIVPSTNHLLSTVNEICEQYEMPALFVERAVSGRDFSFMVQQLKNAYSSLKIIVLTSGVERERLMHLYESGADNFITKPVSANTLIEKLAYTLKPQGKLGQFLDMAKKHLKSGDPEGALELCNRVLEIKPNSAAGFLVRGDAYMAMQQMDEAKEAYVQASNNSQIFLEPLHRLAELSGTCGDALQRLRYLERLDKLSPFNVERKVDMGEIHLQLGQEEEAEALFIAAVENALREAANQVSYLSTRIADMYAASNPALAERYLRTGLSIKGNAYSREDLELFNRLGISLRQQGRWKDALTEYQKACTIAPDDENLYYNMGMACAEGKDFAASGKYMLKALELNTELPKTNQQLAYNMGYVFSLAGLREYSIDCLKDALELNPEYEQAKALLTKVKSGLNSGY